MNDDFFYTQVTVAVYGLLIFLWLYIVLFYIRQYRKRIKSNNAISLLLIILGIDAVRSLFESSYFGVWYMSLAGWLDIDIFHLLLQPENVIIPKLVNLSSTLLMVFFLHKYLQRQNQIYRNSILDPLTQTYNRHYFYEMLFNKRRRSYETPVSYILIDLDNFKNINDQFGHHIGDQVLVAAANTIKGQIREEDLTVRWGGEEFLVILFGTKQEHAQTVAEKLRAEIESLKFEQHNIQASASLSVMEVNQQAYDRAAFEAAFKRLDKALYQAKEAGKNTIRLAKAG